MLDIRLLRSEPDFVKDRLRSRGADTAAVDRVLDIDTRWRATKAEAEQLQAKLNAESKTTGQRIGQLMKDGKKDEADAVRAELRDLGDRVATLDEEARKLSAEIDEILFYIPNLPHETTPSGGEELSYLSYMFRIFKWS